MKFLKKQITGEIWLILIAALVAGVISGVSIIRVTGNSSNDMEIYKVGQKISESDFSVEVKNARVENLNEPNSGMTIQYQVVNLQIKNNGRQKLPFIPVFQTYIRDHDGNIFEMSPLPGIDSIYAGDIAPGAAVSGELSYLLPSDFDLIKNQLFFFFDPGWNQEDAIYVEL